MAITVGVCKCASIKSSKAIVTTAPGIQATTTLNHKDHISFLRIEPFLLIPSSDPFF